MDHEECISEQLANFILNLQVLIKYLLLKLTLMEMNNLSAVIVLTD